MTSSALGVSQQDPCMAWALLLQEGDPTPLHCSEFTLGTSSLSCAFLWK